MYSYRHITRCHFVYRYLMGPHINGNTKALIEVRERAKAAAKKTAEELNK